MMSLRRGLKGSSLPSELNLASDWRTYKSGPCQQCMSSRCPLFFKAFLFFVVSLVWTSGVADVVLALLFKVFREHGTLWFNEISLPTNICLGLGVATILTGIVCWYALVKRAVRILYLVCLLFGLVFVAHSAVAMMLFSATESVRVEVAVSGLQHIQQYVNLLESRKVIDWAQITFSCCGVFSFMDWNENLAFGCNVTTGCVLPDSCCKLGVDCGTLTPQTMSEMVKRVNNEGCVTSVAKILERDLVVGAAISLTFAFIHFLSVLLLHTFIKEIYITKQREIENQSRRLHVQTIYNIT